jgi:hypothetical protein
MSRTKELKSLPENNINVFDLLSFIVPEKKTKYTETLLRLMKKTTGIDTYVKKITEELINENGCNPEINNYSNLQIIFMYNMLQSFFEKKDLENFRKFCEYNERGLIAQNDLSKYNDFSEIINSVDLVSLIVAKKEMEKQIEIVYEDDVWFLLRPLTYESSKKYGSNTKWCTTLEENKSYFDKYTNNGVLIYCINKVTGYKVASFYSLLVLEPEFSFWNQIDKRVDSLETELPLNLVVLIKDISFDKNAVSNKDFYNKKYVSKNLISSRKEEKEHKVSNNYISPGAGVEDVQPQIDVQPQMEEELQFERRRWLERHNADGQDEVNPMPMVEDRTLTPISENEEHMSENEEHMTDLTYPYEREPQMEEVPRTLIGRVRR